MTLYYWYNTSGITNAEISLLYSYELFANIPSEIEVRNTFGMSNVINAVVRPFMGWEMCLFCNLIKHQINQCPATRHFIWLFVPLPW